MLIFLLNGSLPWQGIKAKNKLEKYSKIMDRKIAYTPDELCKNSPDCFIRYFKYCRGLQFDEKPDYKMLRILFKEEMENNLYNYDYQFDWIKILQEKKKEKNVEVNIFNLIDKEKKEKVKENEENLLEEGGK